jgi:hypothetical protein
VLIDLKQKTAELAALDDQFRVMLNRLELAFKRLSVRQLRVPLGTDPHVQLAWAGPNGRRPWRFFLLDDDYVVAREELSRDEQFELFQCGAVERMVRRALQELQESRR